MRKNPLFLQWLLLMSMLFALTLIGALSGVPQWIRRNDPTFISFLICLIGYVTTFRFGSKFHQIGHALAGLTCSGEQYRQARRRVADIQDFLPTAAYVSGLCRDIGFVGTVIGFIMLLPAFVNLGSATPDSVMAIVKSVGVNLGTAFVTTMVGLIASIVIDFQGRRLAYALREVPHD